MGLEGEAGELEPERGRLGVDAVRAAHAQRVGELARAVGERGASAREPGRMTSPARRSWSASAVSSTSEDVSP